MRIFHDVKESLLETYGACIDVTFVAPTWQGVQTLLDELWASYTKISATNGDYEYVDNPESSSVTAWARETPHLHVVLENGDGLIRRLQVFLSPEPEGPFVELTFFPEDIDHSSDLAQAFVAWADAKCASTGARSYFARQENASWKFGDVGPNSGVFLASV